VQILLIGRIRCGLTLDCARGFRLESEGASNGDNVREDYVRVIRAILVRGQHAPDYSSAAKEMVRIQLAPGELHGRVLFSDNGAPETPNVPVDENIDEIRVELKASVKSRPMELDAVKIDARRYRVVLENGLVRVVRLRFEGREAGLMVTHPPRVLATLTDVQVKLLFSDGRRDERGAPASVAAWLEEETLQTENARDVPLEVLLAEPKG
jgi:hypothetical protein